MPNIEHDLPLSPIHDTFRARLLLAAISRAARAGQPLAPDDGAFLASIAAAEGRTALMLAADVGSADCVTALLAADASLIDRQDALGKTALMLAIARANPARRSDAECALALLAHSNVLLTDNQGRSALTLGLATACQNLIEAITRRVAELEAKALGDELALRKREAAGLEHNLPTDATTTTLPGDSAASSARGRCGPSATRRL